MTNELAFTGERFLPGTHGEIWIEHWHRYHFAARWVAGKRVVDVACGEGYGSALLARHAAHVTGVDVSAQAVAHARATYASLANASFVEASCTRMPLADASCDVAVSFETLEHIAEHADFVRELARVLKPDGVLVLSSPNRLEYSDKRAFHNAFHVKELYRDELARLVAPHFPELVWYGQRPSFFSVIAPEGAASAAGQLFEVGEADPSHASPALASPLYFVLVASRSRAALAALAPVVSVLSDREHWLQNDYEKVMKELGEVVTRVHFAEGLIEERDRLVARVQEQLREAREATRATDERLAWTTAEHARMVAELHAVLAAREAAYAEELAAKQAEVDRRGGLRWWLRLPLRRLGILK